MANLKTRLRVCYLLDACSECESQPKANHNGSISAELRKEVCKNCDVFKELEQLRPFMGGKKKEVENKVNLLVDEFIQLHFIEKKTAAEIAELKGVRKQVVYNFKSDHKDEILVLLKEMGLSANDAPHVKRKAKRVVRPPAPASASSPEIDWEVRCKEASALIEDQKLEIKDLLKRIEVYREDIETYQEELKQADAGLHAACADVESELDNIRKENDSLRKENASYIEQRYKDRSHIENQSMRIGTLLSNNSRLVHENKHLKELMKLWI